MLVEHILDQENILKCNCAQFIPDAFTLIIELGVLRYAIEGYKYINAYYSYI